MTKLPRLIKLILNPECWIWLLLTLAALGGLAGCQYRPGYHVETNILHYSDRFKNSQWFAVDGWIYDGLRAEEIIDLKIYTVVYDSLDAGFRIAHQLESDYKARGDSIIKTHIR